MPERSGYLKRWHSGYLEHYGTPRHSGRYPWGSGKNPRQSLNRHFISRDRELKAQGLTEKERAKAWDMTVVEYRARYSAASNAAKKEDIAKVKKLHDHGDSNMAISRATGIPESTIRNYLRPEFEARRDTATKIADELKRQIEERPYLDVGKGVETQLGVSREQLKTAIEILKQEGYSEHRIGIRQTTDPSKQLNVKVLTKGDVSYSDVLANKEKISSPQGVKFEDYADTVKHMEPPKSISSDRVQIRYADDVGPDGATGLDKDGVIEIREGVADLDIGGNRYAQVRIAVDETHYLKGMAMYSNNLPDGVDIVFNTNKSSDTPMINREDKDHSVLKPMKKDKDGNIDIENPFGATVKDQRGALNIVNEEEDWQKWSKTLSAQFLSKQYPTLAKKQLDKTHLERVEEFKDICELTNPVVKRKLLEDFAESCDSASVHLKATSFPRQAAHVILPISSLKDNEIYAPNYDNGEEVVLIRYPHAGVFEIPRLVVNNNNPEGKALLKQAKTAVGINAHVAAQLSGADFDGDTVTVIPTRGLKIRTDKPWKKLQDFNPKTDYPPYEGMPRVGPEHGFHKQTEMGKVSNLITDMTVKGATPDEITKAVRHSMVVIDAEKHNLDWRRSEIDNGIAELKKKYQGKANGGSATLISRAKSEAHPYEYREKRVNEMTDEEKKRHANGELIFVETERLMRDKNGNYTKRATMNSTKMAEAFREGKDATALSSGTIIEDIYADYANKTKALANAARKELYSTGRLILSPSAKKTYEVERASLISKLNMAKKNAPLERQAQLISGVKARTRIEANGIEDKDEMKKIRQQELKRARENVGTRSRNPKAKNSLSIKVTDREWEAIQAGAISHSQLEEILKYCDMDEIRQRATPRKSTRGMSSAVRSRARSLLNRGYSQAEVASELGISVTTLVRELEL